MKEYFEYTEVIELISNNGKYRWIEIKLRQIIENGEIISGLYNTHLK